MVREFTLEEVTQSSGSVLFRLTGRLDAKNAQALVARCNDVYERGSPRVVLNLAGVSFVASSGIGSLLALTERFREVGGGLRLVEVSDAVRSVVELLNLQEFLQIDATEEAGLNAVAR
jgi:anti-sigma B factor antagonist